MSDHANEPSCSKPSAEDSLQLFLDSTDFDDMFDFFMQTSKEDSPRFTSSISCSGTSVAIAGDDAGEPGVTAETPPIPPDEELVRVQVQAPAGPGQRILPNEWQSWRLKLDKKQEAELKNRAAAFWTRETQAASMRRAMWASSNLPIARIKRIIQSGLVRPLVKNLAINCRNSSQLATASKRCSGMPRRCWAETLRKLSLSSLSC
uniref:Uncharacterized protein n=1 Tax=Chrysotila carterae TaxID=13221 RepID=A0A7S4AZQ2_CHRCT